MAKKKPSLKGKQASVTDQPALPPLPPDVLIRLLDSAINGGVGSKGPPANQPAIIPPTGANAGFPQIPQQPSLGGGSGFENVLPKRFGQ